jgi:pimeloyl-ACP methyl ester carboxylesterase
LRVAYRASPPGARDIVFVPNWFFCCEVLPELSSLLGWVEAMTSLGGLIFFDQPGTRVSDPLTAGAMPTLEQWGDSITAVLDDLGSREAVLVAVAGGLPVAVLFAATHPSRTTATTSSNRGGRRSKEIAEFLTGEQDNDRRAVI